MGTRIDHLTFTENEQWGLKLVTTNGEKRYEQVEQVISSAPQG
jgi:hypothetical protein